MGFFTLQKVRGSKVNGVIYKVVTIARPWTTHCYEMVSSYLLYFLLSLMKIIIETHKLLQN